jgi:hypothetical protein
MAGGDVLTEGSLREELLALGTLHLLSLLLGVLGSEIDVSHLGLLSWRGVPVGGGVLAAWVDGGDGQGEC